MRILFAGVAAAALLVAGIAHADAISDRQALMKKNGGAAGVLAKTVKGEMAFDEAAVLAALKTINDDMKQFRELFPAGSETGDTAASPKIWENMDDFKAKIAKMISDTDAAIAAPPKDKDALGPVLGTIGGNCGGCHETYRLQKS